MSNTRGSVATAESALEVLALRGDTLACAESLTGGRLASLLTSVPGASRSFRGAVVSYATQVKIEVLGVPAGLVAEHGVVSAQCAGAMASGVRDVLGATWGVSTTGVAGPDTQEGQSVGTVFVAVATAEDLEVRQVALRGDRASIQAAAVDAALDLLLVVLRREEADLG